MTKTYLYCAQHVHNMAIYLLVLWRHLDGSLWAALIGCKLPIILSWQYCIMGLPVLCTLHADKLELRLQTVAVK